MIAAKARNACRLLGSFSSTIHLKQRRPGRVSLCVLERGISACWRALGREETVTLDNGSLGQPGRQASNCHKRLCVSRGRRKPHKAHGQEQPCLYCSIFEERSAITQEKTCLLALGCSLERSAHAAGIGGQPVTLLRFPFARFLLFPV